MSKKNLILIFFFTAVVVLANFGFPREASAVYYATGTIVSTNLLDGIGAVTSIDSFFASTTFPSASTALAVQFATSSTSGPWYDSQGNLGATTSIVNGTSSIDLSGLGWSGSSFYYKIYFSTTDNSKAPILEEIRIYYTPLPTSRTIIGKGRDTYQLEVDDNLNVAGYINNAAAVSSQMTNVWHHIALSYDTSNVNLYIDGEEKDSYATSSAISENDSSLKIGDLVAGKIDEVRIYDQALSTDEIFQNYNAGKRSIINPNQGETIINP
jgi:hypothetical protein